MQQFQLGIALLCVLYFLFCDSRAAVCTHGIEHGLLFFHKLRIGLLMLIHRRLLHAQHADNGDKQQHAAAQFFDLSAQRSYKNCAENRDENRHICQPRAEKIQLRTRENRCRGKQPCPF